MKKVITIFLSACLIITSCCYKAKYIDAKNSKAPNETKHTDMSFASLDTFSCNKISALKPFRDFNLKKFIQKSTKTSHWIEIMEYPPHVFICQNGYYFLLSTTKNPTGLDTNFYHWLILNNDSIVIADIVSLSKNINNCYIKERKIQMTIYDHDDKYFFKEKSELIPIVKKDYVIKSNFVLNKEHKFYVVE